MEHTKGKWEVQLAQPYDEHEFEISYDTEEGLTYLIADVHGNLEQGDAEANANLIASAPELYEALKAVLTTVVCNGDMTITYGIDGDTRRQIKRALDKAESI